ncbi:uncharacterized protein LOC119303902 [Triticum dicoccoides]|uniref:uncharacterized protein LOC119303902 n=1 Tax=Triticum dicoccoides TaxID=85692 RepID=UPI00188F7953|nr:uncharacterized protein LOC119303902 [Triticum dicoccoides]
MVAAGRIRPPCASPSPPRGSTSRRRDAPNPARFRRVAVGGLTGEAAPRPRMLPPAGFVPRVTPPPPAPRPPRPHPGSGAGATPPSAVARPCLTPSPADLPSTLRGEAMPCWCDWSWVGCGICGQSRGCSQSAFLQAAPSYPAALSFPSCGDGSCAEATKIQCSWIRRRCHPPTAGAARQPPFRHGGSDQRWLPHPRFQIRRLWDCLASGQGEISARFADAGNDDVCRCRFLLGGVVKALGCAPLRAQGKP